MCIKDVSFLCRHIRFIGVRYENEFKNNVENFTKFWDRAGNQERHDKFMGGNTLKTVLTSK